MLTAIVEILASLAPWLLLGAAIAGVLHIWLPNHFVQRHLGGRGGVLKAVLLGVPLPLCSCGVIPTGLGLRKDGASRGATVGFLISTPQTGVDSILVSAGFLGWPFALFKVASAALTGWVGGTLANAVESDSVSGGPHAPADDAPKPHPFRAFWDHVLTILGSIWHWLVFGVVVSAAIEVLVPDQLFAALTAYGTVLPLLGVLALSLPLYVCATASVPIAAALVAGGLPTGAALVFLMAGPATNAATIGAIYRALGRRSLIVYLTTIIVGSIGLGWAFDFVLPADAAVAAHDHGTLSLWRVASIVILVGLIGYFAVRDARDWLRKRRRDRSDQTDVPRLELGVSGMTCEGCARKVEGALRAHPGVESVEVSLKQGSVKVSGTVDPGQVADAVRAAGFTPASSVP